MNLIISDACLGLVESVADFYPDAGWQRCMVHFYRNIFSVVPNTKMKEVTIMLKAIHASEDRATAQEKDSEVIEKLEKMKLWQAAQKIRGSIVKLLDTMIFQVLAGFGFERITHWNELCGKFAKEQMSLAHSLMATQLSC